jgi:hypothetical protein
MHGTTKLDVNADGEGMVILAEVKLGAILTKYTLAYLLF